MPIVFVGSFMSDELKNYLLSQNWPFILCDNKSPITIGYKGEVSD